MDTVRSEDTTLAPVDENQADAKGDLGSGEARRDADDRPSGGKLNGEKATRIVEAMRKCVANYGATGATFDHVSREAGVSRGLLHYYFGSKERLLIEVIRRETDRLISMIATVTDFAGDADQLVDLLVVRVTDILEHEPELFLLSFELIGVARRHPEIGAELADYNRRTRAQLAAILDELQSQGTLDMPHGAIGTASALLAMINGLALEMLQDPSGDHKPTVEASANAVRMLLGTK